jgi:diguanylate cyclase (GGDEF)-like protein
MDITHKLCISGNTLKKSFFIKGLDLLDSLSKHIRHTLLTASNRHSSLIQTNAALSKKKQLDNKVIKEAPLFKEVSPFIRHTILNECPVHQLKNGHILITPGIRNQYIYMVLSGTLSVHIKDPEHPAIRLIQIGETVGELSLIGSTKTSAYVISQGVSEVLAIELHNFWVLVDEMPVIAKNLLHILSGWVRESDKTTLDHQNQIIELEEVSKIDGLTGIHNRRSFDDILNRLLLCSIREQLPLVLIMIDVDHFKKYNDSNGHLGGDQALIALARTLHKTVRPGDFAARYGGEEFAVILPATNLQQCQEVSERLRVTVENLKIVMPDRTTLPPITISMGIAESRLDGDSQERLIERSDAKLYQAKEEGRNRFCL